MIAFENALAAEIAFLKQHRKNNHMVSNGRLISISNGNGAKDMFALLRRFRSIITHAWL